MVQFLSELISAQIAHTEWFESFNRMDEIHWTALTHTITLAWLE